jgi:hypothetical protein
MTSPLIAKDSHPKKDFTGVTQVGLKAYDLGVTHQAVIEPRLPEGTLVGLKEDLDDLGAVVPGAMQARHEAKAATTAQNTRLRQGRTRVRAVRDAVSKSNVSKDIQRAYGVGQATDWARVRDVKAAIKQIVDRATSAPEEAAGFGLLPADVAALQVFLRSITDADATQEKRRASAPLTTKQRNLTANRILLAAGRIAGAGMIAFPDEPLEFGNFKALMEGTKQTAAPKAKPKTDPPAEPAEGRAAAPSSPRKGRPRAAR